MIRGLIVFLGLVLLYHVVRTLIRSAVGAYRTDARKGDRRVLGEEMVQDPECRTYVVKERALTRMVGGKRFYFCSDDCAGKYTDKNRA